VPVIVREADDRAVLELALIENLQRENLNAIEEAQGYAQLVEQFQLKQEEVASKVGKSRAAVANSLRLLKLAPEIQSYLRDGRISVGHAKVILGLANERQQKHAADRILRDGLNVRQTETLVSHLQARATTTTGNVLPLTPKPRTPCGRPGESAPRAAWAPRSACVTRKAKARSKSLSSAMLSSNASCAF